MSKTIFYNAAVVTSEQILQGYSVICEDDKIERIIPARQNYGCGHIIDAQGCYLAPGYIDLHMHGGRGLMLDHSPEAFAQMTRILPEYGVTGFLAGISPTASAEDDCALLESLAQVSSKGSGVMGFFLEGHFVALSGAIYQHPSKPTVEYALGLKEAAMPYPVIFAISPEVEGMEEMLPVLTENGKWPAFITHTKADAEQTLKAIKGGARHATHFYDVFPYPGERDPGVRACGTVEAIYSDPTTSVDFILDGEHVEPIAVKMAHQCKGPDKVCLITDSNINAGMPPGRYTSSGFDVIVEKFGGPARCAENAPRPGMEGTLSGSGLTMDLAVRNAMKFLNTDVGQAIRMASTNPAAVLGMDDRKGVVHEGFDADLVMLDSEMRVVSTWVAGRCRYHR